MVTYLAIGATSPELHGSLPPPPPFLAWIIPPTISLTTTAAATTARKFTHSLLTLTPMRVCRRPIFPRLHWACDCLSLDRARLLAPALTMPAVSAKLGTVVVESAILDLFAVNLL